MNWIQSIWRLLPWPDKIAAGFAVVAFVFQVLVLAGVLKFDFWGMNIVGFVVIAVLALNLTSTAYKSKSDAITQLWRKELDERISATHTEVESSRNEIASIVSRKFPHHVEPTFIKPELEKLLSPEDCSTWKFRGGSGRWQRERVLPELSKVKDRPISYSMLILDLRDDALCKDYAMYRNQHRTGAAATPESVRNDLISCIVAAAWYDARSQVRPEISLNKTYSPLRFDLGNGGAMLTVADHTSPGLLCRPNSWLYRALDDEFDKAVLQSPKIRFKHDRYKLHNAQELTSEIVDHILSTVMVDESSSVSNRLFTDDQLRELDSELIAEKSLFNS